MVELLQIAFSKTPYAISQDQAQRLARHYELLHEANKSTNLTSIATEEEAALLHYADSASPLFFGALKAGDLCCDVGSGAGFPGLVLAILQPDCRFTLLDSQTKRVHFLTDAIRELSLQNAVALHARAEDAGRDAKHRDRYDVVLSRAVAPLPVLCEYCLPLVKAGGRMIAYKGPAADEELAKAARAMDLLGGGNPVVNKSGIAGRSHHLIFIEKTRPTPKQYPRKAGTPEKQPL